MKLKGLELDFVKAKDAIDASQRTDRQKIARLHRLEEEYCYRLAKRPRFALEVKRRIAETLLRMSVTHGRSVATCRARLKSLSKLGFTNIEMKAHYHLIYARAALRQGHRQIAFETATRLAFELKRSLPHRRSLLGRELLGNFEELVRITLAMDQGRPATLPRHW